MIGHTQSLQKVLAQYTHTRIGDWYPVFKARYGMEVVFEALKSVQGSGQVLTQTFTCITAVDPIIQAGLTPVYADIDPKSLSLANPLPVNKQTRAVVRQHTFGIIDSTGMQETKEKMVEDFGNHRPLLMEDCAHCVGHMGRDKAGDPLADITVYSFGVEKMLDTRFGGAIWVNPRLKERSPELDRVIRMKLSSLEPISLRINLVTRAYVNQNRLLSRMGTVGSSLRKTLTNLRMYEPPISDTEMRGELEYKPYRSKPWMNRKTMRQLKGLKANENARKGIVSTYTSLLQNKKGIEIPACAAGVEAAPLLRYPVLMANEEVAERAVAAVRARGILAERWYRPQLFPGITKGFEGIYRIPLDPSALPVASSYSQRIVCLPTEVSADQAEKAVSAILNLI